MSICIVNAYTVHSEFTKLNIKLFRHNLTFMKEKVDEELIQWNFPNIKLDF